MFDHVGIAAADLEAGSAPYRALGLAHEGDATIEGQRVRARVFGAGAGRVELIAPLDDDGPVARFLARRGPGLHHVAFRVHDIDAEIERLRADGARFASEPPAARPGLHGSRVVFLHPAWGEGTLLELVEPAAPPAAGSEAPDAPAERGADGRPRPDGVEPA